MKRIYKAVITLAVMLAMYIGVGNSQPQVHAAARYVEIPIELNVTNVTAIDLKIELNKNYISKVEVIDLCTELNKAMVASNTNGSTFAVAIASDKKIASIGRAFTLRMEVNEDADDTTELYKLKRVSINEKLTMTADHTILISGVKDGGSYSENIQITFNQGTATLNGAPYQSGDLVTEKGKHTLVITDSKGKTRTITFQIAGPHKYSETFTVDQAPTCTQQGEASRHCTEHSDCKERIEVTVIPATGHKKSNWIIDRQPTYDTVGTRYQKCTECGEILVREELPKLERTNISKVTVSGIQTKIYNGKPQTQTLTLKYGTQLLKNGTDYQLSYQNNSNPGTATIVITGKGAFTGQVKKTFTIQFPSMKTVTYKATESAVTLQWASLPGIKGYAVERYDASKKKFVQIKKVTSTKYQDSKLKNGAEYRYRIRPYIIVNNKDQYGSYSAAIVTGTLPLTPSSFKATALKGRKVSLSWKRVTNADGYEIYSSNKKSGSYKKIATLKKGKTVSYTNTKLKAGSTYYYKIRSYKKINGTYVYSSWSKVISRKALK